MRKLLAFLVILASAAQNKIEERFCEKSSVTGIDFICGESKPTPFQPCTDLKLINGTASTATLLWLLAEKHNRYDLTLRCIQSLTQGAGNHIIYIEGLESGEIASCDVYRGLADKQGRACKGWDDMDSHRKAEALMIGFEEDTYQRRLIHREILDLKKIYESEAQFKLKIQQMKTKANDPKQKNPPLLAAIDWIMEQTKKSKSYRVALDTPFPLSNPEGYNMRRKDLGKYKMFSENRDRSFQKTIREHPKNTLGIFVAGYNHAKPEGTLNELEKLAGPNRFAVLAPK